MSAELAVSYKLKTDSVIQQKCGNNPVRVFLNKRPQKMGLPAIVVRRYGTSPNNTKDGPSELDETRVQVLLYVANLDTASYELEARIRTVLDQVGVSGIVNGIDLESCTYEDDDQFPELIDNQEVNVFEHIYKTLIKR